MNRIRSRYRPLLNDARNKCLFFFTNIYTGPIHFNSKSLLVKPNCVKTATSFGLETKYCQHDTMLFLPYVGNWPRLMLVNNEAWWQQYKRDMQNLISGSVFRDLGYIKTTPIHRHAHMQCLLYCKGICNV